MQVLASARDRRRGGARADRRPPRRSCDPRSSAAERKLANQGFVAKAPAEVVEEEREKLDRYRAELEELARLSSDGRPDAEAYLDSLEPLGWRLGLDRIHRLTSVLGMPQHRFASIHVVGTNGKSSVAQMTAALLEAHGVRAGAYLSPHLLRWAERVQIGGEEIGAADFADAVERTAQAAEVVNRSLEDEGDAVTQFEVATAAAFVALAAARVQARRDRGRAGGRLDATNVIPSRVTALTSVGLDHTEWLGETEVEIAAEKLAVLARPVDPGAGPGPRSGAALAERTGRRARARLVRAPADPGPEIRCGPRDRSSAATSPLPSPAAEPSWKGWTPAR